MCYNSDASPRKCHNGTGLRTSVSMVFVIYLYKKYISNDILHIEHRTISSQSKGIYKHFMHQFLLHIVCYFIVVIIIIITAIFMQSLIQPLSLVQSLAMIIVIFFSCEYKDKNVMCSYLKNKRWLEWYITNTRNIVKATYFTHLMIRIIYKIIILHIYKANSMLPDEVFTLLEKGKRNQLDIGRFWSMYFEWQPERKFPHIFNWCLQIVSTVIWVTLKWLDIYVSRLMECDRSSYTVNWKCSFRA